MSALADPRFYYLANFHKALAWLGERYADLFDASEREFLRRFDELPLASRALLVRLIMRKGPHFRASKLDYAEIGCPHQAAAPLLRAGWLDAGAALTLDEVFALLRKDEVLASFAALPARTTLRKAELLEQLRETFSEPRPFAAWCPQLDDRLFSLTLGELCERLRLMFFGNLRQDWSEFVLTDLGILRYETPVLTPESRGFASRAEIDAQLRLQRCREAFEAGAPVDALLPAIAALDGDSAHLQRRRGRLLLQIGQRLEREGQWETALAVYAESSHGAARQRRVRLLERLQRFAEAHELACQAAAAPHDAAEAQLIERALLRLRRQLGMAQPGKPKATPPARLDLRLEPCAGLSVEQCVQRHLERPEAPVHYVENTLICSLFGLLCWEVIFAPLPGAFFHPFHSGPADLFDSQFRARRAERFAARLALLDDGRHADEIRRIHRVKNGLQSPFVHWELLDETLLEQALACLPAAHLKHWFERLLQDLQANRAGMPDLIQFWPAEGRYRMIEVKGPGDRLQDNQQRWLAFCAEHGMPVEVCYVQWLGQDDPA
ncbi:VRR-NUC domain-containing protein [Pseudomonas panipatensis]|uniref:phosphodiesterase I n=1 Tax=Pseudomonas panipatensis TaxID=428992 RepID=A0A1G8FP21_9PSED|nr:VRR-NUC domain-containing protein [Pseudomonas panipatensis]SDH83851.1 VRR-NUC domain-containing protein [Pseudomonas panipatensis]SMP52779.1 VRR-NUC domain-containing protein [Pseudomonas panipatensis]